MTSDSIFTIHKFQIQVKELNKPIYLIPFGDVHRFAPICDEEKWIDFLIWAKHKPNCYFLGMGDYDDLASCSERKALLQACLHESTQATIDEIFVSRVEKLSQELSFMKGRLIGLLEGNHHGVLQSGITTTQMMCQKLETKYLGVSSFIRLSFHHGTSKRASVDLWAHHGRGASRQAGGSLNSVEQMAGMGNAQIYLMGHDHKKSAAFKTQLHLTDGGNSLKLSQRKVLLARTGAFLKGYVDGEPSYIARAALNPTDLGTLKIELTPKRDKKDHNDSFYMDIHCSL